MESHEKWVIEVEKQAQRIASPLEVRFIKRREANM